LYFAAISLQCAHLTISVLPQEGHGNLAADSAEILFLHDVQISSVILVCVFLVNLKRLLFG
jgi:hypothetical protein